MQPLDFLCRQQPFEQILLHGNGNSITIPSMSVGIGAICESGRTAVLAADRMLTYDQMQYEADICKIERISKHTLVAVSSNAIPYGRIIFDKTKKLGGESIESMSIQQIAELLKKAREELRSEYLEITYLRKPLGMNMGDFSKIIVQHPNSLIVQEIYNQLSKATLAVYMLAAGTDEAGAHLFRVDEWTHAYSANDVGYDVIGSGTPQAMSCFARRHHQKSSSLEEGIYNVYEAKRAAELSVGVGKATDIAIVRRGKESVFLDGKVLSKLQEIHDRMKPPPLAVRDRKAIGDLIPI